MPTDKSELTYKVHIAGGPNTRVGKVLAEIWASAAARKIGNLPQPGDDGTKTGCSSEEGSQ